MKIEEMNMLHLVTLSGGGDTYHKLVGPKTFEFICGEWNGKPGVTGYDEMIPEAVMTEIDCLNPDWRLSRHFSDSIHITIGSYDNDRAIQIKGKDFDSATQAVTWAINNGIELGEEFDGCIY